MRIIQDLCKVAVPVFLVFLGVVFIGYYATFTF